MAENRFKARQAKRAADEENRLEQAKGKSALIQALAKQDATKPNGGGTTPVQFYISKDLKKRLKTYCASTDEKMTDVAIIALNEYLESKGF